MIKGPVYKTLVDNFDTLIGCYYCYDWHAGNKGLSAHRKIIDVTMSIGYIYIESLDSLGQNKTDQINKGTFKHLNIVILDQPHEIVTYLLTR